MNQDKVVQDLGINIENEKDELKEIDNAMISNNIHIEYQGDYENTE